MKTKLSILSGVSALLLATVSLEAQTASPTPVPLTFGIGQPVTINGQTFVVMTNASGGMTIVSFGAAGNLTNTPPTNMQDFLANLNGMVNANNPSNAYYYDPHEIEAKVGAVYVQNTGQAAAKLDIEKWGVLKTNVGVGAAVLEGNSHGQNGTAGGYGHIDYRKIIGDVSGSIGLGGGYDNLNKSAMGVFQAEVEYRYKQHLGSYIGAGYALERQGAVKNTSQGGGMVIGGGISYSF